MRYRLIKAAFPSTLAVIMVLGASGCGKKATQQVAPPPAPASDSQPATRQAQQSVQSPGQPAVQQNGEPDLSEINRALIRWIVGHKRRPASYEEFAASAGTPIPPPPPGKKYVLANPPRIQLVNQ